MVGREPVGQRAKGFRRLIEPQARHNLRRLFGMLHPGRLPRYPRNEVGFLPQPCRQRARQPFRLLAVGSAHGDDEFPGVGEVFLVKLQALHRRLVGGQQIQNLRVKPQPA